MSPVYELNDLVKIRAEGTTQFKLVVPKLEIQHGEKIALVGPSGCGKSTLLDIFALVLSPTQAETFQFNPKHSKAANVGKYWLRRKYNQLSDLRKHHIGYVLQTGGLLPYLTVRENIDLSRRLNKKRKRGMVDALADELGIRKHLNKTPANLSVGERQRVAIARALAHRPSIVIADEPTASLDPLSAEKTMALFMRLADELGLTMIVASHDMKLMKKLGLRPLTQRFYQFGESETISEFRE